MDNVSRRNYWLHNSVIQKSYFKVACLAILVLFGLGRVVPGNEVRKLIASDIECKSRFTGRILQDSISQSRPAGVKAFDLSEKYLVYTSSIDGWMDPIHHYVVKSLSDAQSSQSISGLIGEIGVHHGKFFFSLATNLMPGEYAVAFDVFDNQTMNVDGSGNGSLKIFKGHAKIIGFSTESIRVEMGDSNAITERQLKDISSFSYRIFSVDGGHTRATTINDLFLAQSVLHEAGFVVLDDFVNADWLGVIDGFFTYINKCDSDLRPFLWLSNKIYLSHKSWHNFYLEQVQNLGIVECSSTAGFHESRFSIDQYKLCVGHEKV